MDMENEIEEMEQYVRAQCPYCGEPEAPATGAGFSYCPACGYDLVECVRSGAKRQGKGLG